MRLVRLFEDLDDRDEFGYPIITAAYADNEAGHNRLYVAFEDGAKVFSHALPSNAGGDMLWKFYDVDGQVHRSIPVNYLSAIGEYRNSYYVEFTPEVWAAWKRAFGALT